MLKNFLPSNNAILCYHSVGDPNEYGNISASRLSRDIRFLQERYEIVELSTVVEDSFKNPKQVALTFDDGYMNFKTKAFPILKKFNCPATVFVTSNAITGKPIVPEFGNTMKVKDLLELVDSDLVRIENHTMTHSKLAMIEDPREIQREIVGAKKCLEDLLGIKVDSLSYPNNSYNDLVVDIARSSHKLALTTEYGLIESQNDKYVLPRIEVHRNERLWRFMITDSYNLIFKKPKMIIS